MKIKLIFLISLFLITCNSFAQVTFQKVITAPQGSAAYAIQQTFDGGYIITGNMVDPVSTNSDAYLIKTDAEGNAIWTKTFAGIDDNYGYSVQQTMDSGYIMTGFIYSFGPSEVLYVIKTDINGDTLWTQTYNEIEGETGYFIQQTSDSGYIITGTTNSFGAGLDDIYLLKIDANGNILWTQSYGGTNNEEGYCVRQTADKGYIICGATSSFGAGGDDVYLIKTNSLGDTLWTKAYGGADDDYGYSIQLTTDGGYIITGYTYSFGDGINNVYLIKTNANGDITWTKTYGGTESDFGYYVQQTTDGGYIIAGNSNSFGEINGDIYLIKTDAAGNLLWANTFGGNYSDIGNAVSQTTDGGYIIAGTTSSFGSSAAVSAVYLIKTDASGNTDCNESGTGTVVDSASTRVTRTNASISSGGSASPALTSIGNGGNDSTLCSTVGIHGESINNSISIYPNPAGNQITVYGLLRGTNQSLIIYNMLGEVVITHLSTQLSINVSLLPSGFYFVRMTDEKQSRVGKFVKE